MSRQFVPCGQCKQSDDLSQPGTGTCAKCKGKGTRRKTCDRCNGTQHFGSYACTHCGGKGSVITGHRACAACNGKGWDERWYTCKKCDGKKILPNHGTCPVCAGKQRLPSKCIDCAGRGTVKKSCKRCDGLGTCSGCKGTGWIRPIIVRGR